MKKKVLVLFLGNILRGDDGVGIELLKRISQSEISENVVLEEGSTGGMILLGVMDDYDSVIIVDAMDSTDLKQDIIIFDPSFIQDTNEREISLHSISIKDIVRFNQALGERVPKITIFGIRIDRIDEHIGLSTELMNRLSFIEDRLIHLIRETAS